jgi:hypothetical protein
MPEKKRIVKENISICVFSWKWSVDKIKIWNSHITFMGFQWYIYPCGWHVEWPISLCFGAKAKEDGVEEKPLLWRHRHAPAAANYHGSMFPLPHTAAALKCPGCPWSLTLRTTNKVKEPLATGQTHAKLIPQESYLGDMNAQQDISTVVVLM